MIRLPTLLLAAVAVAAALLAPASASVAVPLPDAEWKEVDGMMPAPAPAPALASSVPPPLVQIGEGASYEKVVCNPGMILLFSPGGMPACVFGESLGALAGRGWTGAASTSAAGGGGPGPSIPPPPPLFAGQASSSPPDPPPPTAAGAAAASAPTPPLLNQANLTISGYPLVGQAGEVEFSITYSGCCGQPAASLVVGPGAHRNPRMFDVVSNIDSGDPDVFLPYDHKNVTKLVQIGETYTVRAKFEVLRQEAFLGICGAGVSDRVCKDIAASKHRSMSADDYIATGQTYLDHIKSPALGVMPPLFPPFYGKLPVPNHPITGDTVRERDVYSVLAKSYLELSAAGDIVPVVERHSKADPSYARLALEDALVNELFYLGFLRGDIREFFVHAMNYTEAEADAVAVDDVLLADAYRTSGARAGDVVDDLVARRNYTADEVRGFFADHMGYAAGEAAAMNIDEDASRERVAATAAAKAEREAYAAARAAAKNDRPLLTDPSSMLVKPVAMARNPINSATEEIDSYRMMGRLYAEESDYLITTLRHPDKADPSFSRLALEDYIVEDLFRHGYLRGDIREFFVLVMNYTEAEAGAVAVDDALLAGAYNWEYRYEGEVVDDLVARRNYTAGEVRDFLRDHMRYTAGEAAAVEIDEDASRERIAARSVTVAGHQGSQSGLFDVSGKVRAPAPYTGRAMDVHGMRVCAYDQNAATGQVTLLRALSREACTYTADSGTYNIRSIQNVDPDGDDTNVDLALRVSTDGYRDIRVVD